MMQVRGEGAEQEKGRREEIQEANEEGRVYRKDPPSPLQTAVPVFSYDFWKLFESVGEIFTVSSSSLVSVSILIVRLRCCATYKYDGLA